MDHQPITHQQTHQFTTSLPPILWGKIVHRRAAEITENAQSNLWRDVEEPKISSKINNPCEKDILPTTSRSRPRNQLTKSQTHQFITEKADSPIHN